MKILLHVNYYEGKGRLRSLFELASQYGYDGVELRWKYAFIEGIFQYPVKGSGVIRGNAWGVKNLPLFEAKSPFPFRKKLFQIRLSLTEASRCLPENRDKLRTRR